MTTEMRPEIIIRQDGEFTSKPIILRNNLVTANIDAFGGFVNSLRIDGINILWRRFPLAEFGQVSRKRGGIPVLGPTPGPVKDTAWIEKGVPVTMPQHGTDRRVEWEVTELYGDMVVLERIIPESEFGIGASHKTARFTLLPTGVGLSATILNLEDHPIEVGHAWHPYFRRWGLEITGKLAQKIAGQDLSKAVIVPGSEIGNEIALKFGGQALRILTHTTPLNWVVWSDCQNRYIAIEPWWAGIGQGVQVGPGQEESFSMSIIRVD